VDNPDDALQRIAKALAGDDGCCCLWDIDGRCCMTDKARLVIAVMLHEIDACGLEAGAYTGVLDIFARRNGVEFEHAKFESS
jgi:hypothetical protein